MKVKKSSLRKTIYPTLVLLLILTACGSATPADSEAPVVNTEPPVSTPLPMTTIETSSPAPAAVTEAPSQISAEILDSLMDAADPCSLVTKEQVESVFGKSVQETDSDEESYGSSCEYDFGENSKLHVTVYAGEKATNFYATIITAGQQGCNEYLNALVDVSSAPPADPSLLKTPLDSLYHQYFDMVSKCAYVHTEERVDLSESVMTAETIFLDWSSSVAVLSDNKVIEFSYNESIPSDTTAEFEHAATIEEFYTLAEPYREQVLSGYTELLITLFLQPIDQ
ncbi:MAG: hypothetical protein HS124_12965 [Anaerolineales bacterium]|nr:hypothetical protein [Anaerolineales bacterium]MCL4260505.1 hypothetical protein [Anaerolineales bacterium]